MPADWWCSGCDIWLCYVCLELWGCGCGRIPPVAADAGRQQPELGGDIEKVTVNGEDTAVKLAQSKSAVKPVQAGLAALANEQADMDKIRLEESDAYKSAKADHDRSAAPARRRAREERQLQIAVADATATTQNDGGAVSHTGSTSSPRFATR